MKLTDVKTAVKAGTFTCSSCAQLLAEQPTAGEVSHAHMHTLDPFSVDVGKIKPASFKAPSTLDLTAYQSQRKGFWGNPEIQLNPLNTGPYAANSIDSTTTTTDMLSPLNLYMDKDRLAVNDTYLKRGMADIPEKIDTTYEHHLVYKKSPKDAKPAMEKFPIPNAAASAIPSLPKDALVTKDLGVKTIETQVHPKYLAMEAHTMFEDSEVLVMSCTAVLLSEAGYQALKVLKAQPVGTYVAVFSASAVKAVEDTFKKKAPTKPSLQMAERSPTTVSVDTTGKQPVLKTTGATYTKLSMSRVVLVMKKDGSDNLIVVTCYPASKDPVPTAAKPYPTTTDDFMEPAKGTYTVVKQTKPIALDW